MAMTDDLDRLLAPIPAPTDAAAKEALFRRTAGVLARRQLARRAIARGAFGLIFAGGLGAGWFFRPAPLATAPELIPVPVPVPLPDHAPESEPSAPVALSAPQLELEAEKTTDPDRSAQLFRQAGDKYLTDATDIASATRCYGYHLAETGPAGLAIRSDDSWLLIRMKTSRSKENENEPNAGT
jgi:hypothetical protein